MLFKEAKYRKVQLYLKSKVKLEEDLKAWGFDKYVEHMGKNTGQMTTMSQSCCLT